MSLPIEKLVVEGSKALTEFAESSIVPSIVEGVLHSIVEGIEVVEKQKTRRLEVELLFAAKSTGDVLSCLQKILTEYCQYKIIYEQELTKRQQITAWENVAITNIENQRDIVIEYLEKSFNERSKNFEKLFDVVDNAIEIGSNQQLAIALNSIVSLAESSPFKELGNLDFIRANFGDPNYVWKIGK